MAKSRKRSPSKSRGKSRSSASKTAKGNKRLHKLREKCTNLALCCHKNVNRILDCMVHDKENCAHLCEFAKCCIIMEKTCECVTSCCCNAEHVSKHLECELDSKCAHIVRCCDKLMKCLSKERCKYLRCDKIKKMCK